MLDLLALTVLLHSVALAAPQFARQDAVASKYPPTQSSTGFRLIANVSDPSQDFDPPVRGWILDAIHTGAGLNDAVLFADGDDIGRTYYVNGTADEVAAGRADTLTDGGTPPFPYAVSVADRNTTDADGLHDVSVNAGSGDAGVQLEVASSSYPILRGPGAAMGTYVACDQYVEYYDENYTTIRWVYDVQVDGGSSHAGAAAAVTNSTSNTTLAAPPTAPVWLRTIPDGCIAVTLLPECEVLEDLPEESISSHEFAANSTCYDSVSDIDWSLYGP
ncbi:hypothetical protein E8E14_010377 [Neopestalotiopsis sp. 37M]|nr:hypothetical protein E8E14_010377 [Neopestalotiopsis sp. 37M]